MYICTFICSILKYTKCKHGERLRNEKSDFYGKKNVIMCVITIKNINKIIYFVEKINQKAFC